MREQTPLAGEREGPRAAAAPSALYRYRPVPPFGVDDDGYLREDSVPQHSLHSEAVQYAAMALETRFRGLAAVHSDLAVAYAEGDRSAILCPDVMVTFGAAQKERGNWKLWESPLPDFVLEVLSRETWRTDVGAQKDTYACLGVKECWLFDPRRQWLSDGLEGYRLRKGAYVRLKPRASGRLRSDALGLDLRAEGALLRFYDGDSGEPLRTLAEAEALVRKLEARLSALPGQRSS